VDYTTTATRQNNNQNQRTNLCNVITKKAIREFLPNTERGRDIGMKLTVDRGYVVLGMRYYLKNLLEPFNNPQVKLVPVNKETFTFKEAAEKLDLKKWMQFHSTVASSFIYPRELVRI